MTLPPANSPPIVVITGGLSGIGLATAEAFHKLPAHLVLWDLATAPPADVLAADEGVTVEPIIDHVDVRRFDDVVAAADRVTRRFGRVDALVVSAGITDHSRIDSGDPERWRAVIDTNLLGCLHTVRAVLPTMRQQGHGHIIIVASVSGRETYVGEPAYIASKWGQVGFAHALREEAREYGVRATLIEPGLVDTPLTRDNPIVRPLLDAIEPLTPHHVAAAVLFAFSQPQEVLVSELTVRPLRQGKPDFRPDQTH